MFFWRVLQICEEERWHTVSLQKFNKEIHLRSHHWSFPTLSASQQTVFRCLYPRFYWRKQSIRAFAKALRKTGNIASVLEPRNGKKPTANEQMKKLPYSGELGRAESKNPAQLQRKAYFYLGLFFGRRGRQNQCQLTATILSLRKIHEGVEYF